MQMDQPSALRNSTKDLKSEKKCERRRTTEELKSGMKCGRRHAIGYIVRRSHLLKA